MRTIHKFTHPVAETIQLHIPNDAVFLRVGRDTRHTDELAFWFEVDSDQKETIRHTYDLVGTGHPVPKTATRYLDSVMMAPFIWHVYQRTY